MADQAIMLKRLRRSVTASTEGIPSAAVSGRTAVRFRERASSGEYQGVEHCVTVRDEDFEYQGRPYKSLSAHRARDHRTRWNGLMFFGLKNYQASL